MKIHLSSLIKLKPILVGLAVFSLMWMVMQEIDFRHRYYHDPSYFGSHVTPPLYDDEIFLSFLLVIASLTILLKRIWSQATAMILSGLVVLQRVIDDLWWDSISLEVPRFSDAHLQSVYQGLWLPDEELLFIILAGVMLSCSAWSLIRLIRKRKYPTMSNESLERSAG